MADNTENIEITGDEYMDDCVIDAYDKTEELEKSIDECEREFNETQPETDTEPCNIPETVNKWTEISAKVNTKVGETSGSIKLYNGCENNVGMQLVFKKLQLCLLRAKRLILKIKLKIAIFRKKLVLGMINGNGSAVPDPTSTSVNTAFTVLGMAVNIVLQVVEAFLTMISISPIGVGPQAIVFFLTPKSLYKTEAPAYNPNNSICDRFPESVKKTIHAIEKSVEKANKALKIATIAAGAASGAVEILSKNPKFKKNATFNKLRPGELQKQIEDYSDLLPIPMGMPKYEKLKLTNIGFMTYLITGFEPAAHKSFGIPGYF